MHSLPKRSFLIALSAAAALPASADAAVTATLNADQTLRVVGDTAANTIAVSRDAAGNILVNGGAVRVPVGTPTVANVTTIQLLGLGGADVLRLDEAVGPLPRAVALGGTGDDFLVGGSKADQLFGEGGNDTVDGRGGADIVQLGDDTDKALWAPGGGNDTVIGGAGHDRLRTVGSPADDRFAVSGNRVTHGASGAQTTSSQIEETTITPGGGADTSTVDATPQAGLAPVAFDLASLPGAATGDGQRDRIAVTGADDRGDVVTLAAEGAAPAPIGPTITLRGGEPALDTVDVSTGGDRDIVNASQMPAGEAVVTIDGGAEGDLLSGSSGADRIVAGAGDDDLRAGAGDDFLDAGEGADRVDAGAGSDAVFGGLGDDRADLGADDDRFIWGPGNGSDTVEGDAGSDRVLVGGALVDEQFEVAAAGPRVRVSRDRAVATDVDGVELIAAAPSRGADGVRVGDLSGTAVERVDADLSASGTGGDEQPDFLIVAGSEATDGIEVTGAAGAASVRGTAATVDVRHVEAGDDLVVETGAGDDRIAATRLDPGTLDLSVVAGEGADTVVGGRSRELLLGGAGSDNVAGGQGDDTVLLGPDADRFAWNAGDGSDVVEGGTGQDRLAVTGTDTDERIDVATNGPRLVVRRDIGAVTLDTAGLEVLEAAVLGGADVVRFADLSGTALRKTVLKLATTVAGRTGDGESDRVEVDGTAGADRFVLTGGNGSATVTGLPVRTEISGAEVAHDLLALEGGAGDDTIDHVALGLRAIAFSFSQ